MAAEAAIGPSPGRPSTSASISSTATRPIVLQAVEFHGTGLILYDTGDFIDDLIVAPGFRSDHSFLFLVEAGRGSRRACAWCPAKLTLAKVNIARGRDAEAIRRDMIRRCRGYAVEHSRGGWRTDRHAAGRARLDRASAPLMPGPPPKPIASARSTANSRKR